MRQWGARLTMLWINYYDDYTRFDQLRSLLRASVGRPDAIIVSVGSWYASFGQCRLCSRGVGPAYSHSLQRLLRDIEDSLDQLRPATYFRHLWPNETTLVFAGVTFCEHMTSSALKANVTTINRLANEVVTARNSQLRRASPMGSDFVRHSQPAVRAWEWLDRVRTTPCDAECTAGPFHPIGSTLNRLSMALCKHAFGLRLGT